MSKQQVKTQKVDVTAVATAMAERSNRISWRISRSEPIPGFEFKPADWKKYAENLLTLVDELGYEMVPKQ